MHFNKVVGGSNNEMNDDNGAGDTAQKMRGLKTFMCRVNPGPLTLYLKA